MFIFVVCYLYSEKVSLIKLKYNYLIKVVMEKDYELNSKICNKENSDLVYLIIGKKYLNGILHYHLETETGQIYLSEFALNDRYIRIEKIKNNDTNKPIASRLYSKITNTLNKN